MTMSRITKYAIEILLHKIEILLRNTNRKDQGQYQCFTDPRERKRI